MKMILYRFLEKKITIILLIVIYRVLFDYIYVLYTNPIWGYAGFANNDSKESLIISWIVLILLSFPLLSYINNKDTFYPDLIILFFVMRVVPFTTLVRFLNTPTGLNISFFVYFFLLFFVTKYMKVRQVTLRESHYNDNILYLGLLFFSLIIIFISGVYANFRFHLSFDDVYDLRKEAKDFALPIIIRYAWSPATNILPLFFVYFFQKKKQSICLFIIFIILLNFSINGMKSTILKLIICLFFYFFKIDDFKRYYLPLFLIVLLITIMEGFLWNSCFIHDLIVRRVFFIPGLLDTYYYDYITQHGPMFYSREGTAIQYIIGDVYYNSPEMDCNNGLFSDAFMNLGRLGCIVYPFILAFLLKLCGSAFRGADKGLVIFAAFIMSYTLEGSELTTGLLTHGLFLFSIFLYWISKNKYQSYYSDKRN